MAFSFSSNIATAFSTRRRSKQLPRRRALGQQLQQAVSAVVLGSDAERAGAGDCGYDLAKVIYGRQREACRLHSRWLHRRDGARRARNSIRNSWSCRTLIWCATLLRSWRRVLASRLISDCIRAKSRAARSRFTRRIFLGKLDADVVSDGERAGLCHVSIRCLPAGSGSEGKRRAGRDDAVEVGEIRMTSGSAVPGSETGGRSQQGRHHRGRRSWHQEQRQSGAGGKTG